MEYIPKRIKSAYSTKRDEIETSLFSINNTLEKIKRQGVYKNDAEIRRTSLKGESTDIESIRKQLDTIRQALLILRKQYETLEEVNPTIKGLIIGEPTMDRLISVINTDLIEYEHILGEYNKL
jgi:hypothetical protein